MSEVAERRLREQCEKKIDELGLPYRFTTRQFCDAIADRRGKGIIFNPLPDFVISGGVCGMRVETQTSDVIFYAQGISVHHQRHILAHELSHVYCDHPGRLVADSDTGELFRASGRTGYSTGEEREAEIMASLVRRRIYQDRDAPPRRPETSPARWDALFAQPFPTAWRRGR
ncbi:regulator component [Streptomyces sp. SAS_281]|uniref:regulator component n=1 Tax=Streptomyces sp. SAS_281 TaxID=3412744 RepID=UPI00403CE98F